jgi:GxxExxY protein
VGRKEIRDQAVQSQLNLRLSGNHINHQGTKAPRPPIPEEVDQVARLVVDAAFKVHSQLGPGLLESVYEVCLAHEVEKLGARVERQVALPVLYDGIRMDAGLRVDLVINRSLIVENKAIEALLPIPEAQLLTYLKLTGYRLGLLINFNVALIKDGIKRITL